MILKRMIARIDKVGQVLRNPKLEIILLVFLPLALLLRIPNLQSKPIWYDEAFSIFLSRQSLAEVISGTAADTMPPLYYFLMHGWMFLNRQIWFLRTLNVIISLGIVTLVYVATSSWLGQSAGLWAALFTAVSPLQIYHAQELRMYALLTLALLGYIHFFM
ncbi:MAG: glycosyltransferase family 39 protein, partial [Anaerolineales bacterium]|nr:glycosyltransferase family 39 protein [Anaerolineales bacterium]